MLELREKYSSSSEREENQKTMYYLLYRAKDRTRRHDQEKDLTSIEWDRTIDTTDRFTSLPAPVYVSIDLVLFQRLVAAVTSEEDHGLLLEYLSYRRYIDTTAIGSSIVDCWCVVWWFVKYHVGRKGGGFRWFSTIETFEGQTGLIYSYGTGLDLACRWRT